MKPFKNHLKFQTVSSCFNKFLLFNWLLPIANCLLPIASLAQWQTQTSPTTAWLKDIVCTNANTCFAVGWKGTVIRTTDGTHWDTLNTGSKEFLTSIIAINKDVLLTGSYNGVVLKSLDAGQTWSTKDTLPMGISNLYKLNDTIIYATGYGGGQMQRSTDGGKTWQWVETRCKGIISSVDFVDINTGYAVETTWDRKNRKFVGVINRTDNGGKTWGKNFEIRNNVQLNKVKFITAKTGFVITDGGYIFQTADSAKTWNSITSSIGNNLLDIFFIDKDVGYIVGTRGVILKTNNSGNTWTKETSNTDNKLNAVYFLPDNKGYIVGDDAIILTK